MYSYPYANNHFAQLPSFSPMASNIPELQYVNSPESVDSFNIPPNKTGVWFCQNKDEFYIVSTDASGNRVKNEFEYKPKAKTKPTEYVTKAEFDDLKRKCEEIINGADKAPKKGSQKATEGEE